MPNTVNVQNNFIGGLKTEFTGLNFPENAATDTDNCIYTLIGDVVRRDGIDYETNFTQNTIDRTNKAISSYKWNNAGGDGSTQIIVQQVGGTLYFFKSSSATIASPLSTQKLSATITLSSFLPVGSVLDPSLTECQYSDGNGYLFVYHPSLETFYCTYNAGTIVGNLITLTVRDFNGIPEPGIADNLRPTVLTPEHNYNLINQGWTQGNIWFANDDVSTHASTLGATGWTVQAGLAGIVNGQNVNIVNTGRGGVASGVVTGYVGTTLSVTVTGIFYPGYTATGGWTIYPLNTALIDTWKTAIGNYPSNADVWWNFKNTSGTFDPTTMVAKVTIGTGPSPKGFNILSVFNQQPSVITGVVGITPITTTSRPSTGTWFQGRVWFTGVSASQPASGDQNYYTWTENIYFSQIITNVTQFGKCYQTNDPTSENLFDLLPTDGGVITIQGCGSIYKLFPVQNGLLVFAANGIWFITGSQGIGFSATDYTITKISSVQSISSTSFVNVLGYPTFWNEEGIYTVAPDSKSSGLLVENLCIGTILDYFSEIPLQSKKFARGDYSPIDFTIQWTFRSTNESGVTSRYEYDKILNLNTANKAFFPYSFSGTPKINGVIYVAGPGGSTTPSPTFKYIVSKSNAGSYQFSFGEEHDNTHWVDWFSQDSVGVNYNSYFVTGFRIAGKALTKWQPQYVYIFLRNQGVNSYKIQGIWDFASAQDSNRFSTIQVITDYRPNYNMLYRRHKIRGHGLVLQFKISSVDNKPFDIMGWSSLEQTNQGT